MGKFWQISTEFWPLIDVRNLFSLSIFGIFFFKMIFIALKISRGRVCCMPSALLFKCKIVNIFLSIGLHLCLCPVSASSVHFYMICVSATCEMIAIMQEHGEVVLCVGSSLNKQNVPMFLLADCR